MRRPAAGRIAPLVIALGLSAAACAIVSERVVVPARYKLAGADVTLRQNLDRGLRELQGGNYQAALGALNRAIWDLERIDQAALRRAELGEAYGALADVYTRLRRPDWADEHRSLAKALTQGPAGGASDQALQRGRSAYAAARFPEALRTLRGALVELDGLPSGTARVRAMEEARCYLAFSYVALDQVDRARDEIGRLWALDPALRACQRDASPSIVRLMTDVQRALATPPPRP